MRRATCRAPSPYGSAVSPAFAGWFLPYDKPLLLVVDEGEEEKAVRALVRMGYDSIAGKLSGGMLGWHQGRIKPLPRAWSRRRRRDLLDAGRPRGCSTCGATKSWRRTDASTAATMSTSPNSRSTWMRYRGTGTVYVFCASGLRSTIAASILQRQGWDGVNVVLGGLSGWKSIACPVVS